METLKEKEERLEIKYCKKIRNSIKELGLEYNIYKDIFEMLWEWLPKEFNLSFILKRINYALLEEINMDIIDFYYQDYKGYAINKYTILPDQGFKFFCNYFFKAFFTPELYEKKNNKKQKSDFLYRLETHDLLKNALERLEKKLKKKVEKWKI